jgi:hypothetical protein
MMPPEAAERWTGTSWQHRASLCLRAGATIFSLQVPIWIPTEGGKPWASSPSHSGGLPEWAAHDIANQCKQPMQAVIGVCQLWASSACGNGSLELATRKGQLVVPNP